MVQFLFDREKRQEAARIKELRELLGQVEQADFWGRISKGLSSSTEERDSFWQAIMRRAKTHAVTPEKLLSNYAQQLRESTYPTPECLEAEELQAIVASGAPTTEKFVHLQNCVPCQQLLEACKLSPAEKSALKEMVRKAAAETTQAAGTEIPAPAVDLYEEKDDIVVKAELPGMKKDNIEVNILDNRLTIKGEKKQEEQVKKESYYKTERSYGSFVRTFELPKKVQADKVKAAFKNGILEIRLPKT